MNKIFICSFVATLLFATTFAQTNKDSLLRVIADEVCIQMTKDSANFKEKDDINMDMGLALMPSFTKHQAELEKFYDADMINGAGMEKFGEDVGIKLVAQCPVFIKIIKENKSTFGGLNDDAGTKDASAGTLSGMLIKIVPGDITYFIIKTTNGKSEKIWWQEYFKGAEKISTSNLNKVIKVSYIEKEIYNAALKDYIKQKIAAGAE